MARLVDGQIEAGTRVKARLSSSYRHNVAANHTATICCTMLYGPVWARTSPGRFVRAGGEVPFRFCLSRASGSDPHRGDRRTGQPPHRREPPVRAFITSLEHARDGRHGSVWREVRRFVRVVEIDD